MTLEQIKKIAMKDHQVFRWVIQYNWGHLTMKQLQNYVRVHLNAERV